MFLIEKAREKKHFRYECTVCIIRMLKKVIECLQHYTELQKSKVLLKCAYLSSCRCTLVVQINFIQLIMFKKKIDKVNEFLEFFFYSTKLLKDKMMAHEKQIKEPQNCITRFHHI